MTRPALPPLDLSLARCPGCGHEVLEVVAAGPSAFHTRQVTLRCDLCSLAEPLGYVTRHSRYLFPWVLRRWGVAL